MMYIAKQPRVADVPNGKGDIPMMRRWTIAAAMLLVPASMALADPLAAFPGAEGFGALATGGRGGEVYHVISLADAGPGSFRDAVSKPNRMIVFDVGGIVQLKSPVVGSDNLTIAGQTAPGQGIMLLGHGLSFSGKKNVIVRHMKLRAGIGSSRGSKVLNVADGGGTMIFDHLSIAWGRWDNLGFTEHAHDITIQDSIIGEAIDPQRFGALIDSSENISVLRTLWIDHDSRNPKGKAQMQYINNVIYNWGGTGYAGGHSAAEWHQDLIGNYLIKGPSSNDNYAGGFGKTDILYLKDNLVDLNRDGKLNGRPFNESEFKVMHSDGEPPTVVKEIHNKPPVAATVMSPEKAYEHIVKSAGAYLFRDKTDQRLIEQLTSLGTRGKIIKEEAEVGGAGELTGGEAPKDSDGDGMPDAWESSHGLNPNDKADGAALVKSGYSNLEVYINSLLPEAQ
jgi:hypothetical protein